MHLATAVSITCMKHSLNFICNIWYMFSITYVLNSNTFKCIWNVFNCNWLQYIAFALDGWGIGCSTNQKGQTRDRKVDIFIVYCEYNVHTVYDHPHSLGWMPVMNTLFAKKLNIEKRMTYPKYHSQLCASFLTFIFLKCN